MNQIHSLKKAPHDILKDLLLKQASYSLILATLSKLVTKMGTEQELAITGHSFVPLPVKRLTDTCFPVVRHIQCPQNVNIYYRILNYYHTNALRCNCQYINYCLFPFS